MEKSVIEIEEQVAQALIQLSEADRKGMAPRQMMQVRGGTASPQLIPADAPPQLIPADAPTQDENEQFKRNLALKDFPEKLRLAADHPSLKPIGWSAGGGLAIWSRADFCKDVLPLLCTGTYPSFNRQMSAYGFKKQRNTASDVDVYVHKEDFFLRDQKHLLKKICRRPTQAKVRALAEAIEKLVPVDGPLTSPGPNVTSLQANLTSLAASVTSIRDNLASFGAELDSVQSEIQAMMQKLVDSQANAT